MTGPSVTFTGSEVSLVIGVLAAALPKMCPDDYEVADLMIDRAVASIGCALAPDIQARIAELRARGRQ